MWPVGQLAELSHTDMEGCARAGHELFETTPIKRQPPVPPSPEPLVTTRF